MTTPQNDPTICATCAKNPATVHVRRVQGGAEESVRLCVSCAQAQGLEPGSAVGFTPEVLGKIFQGMDIADDNALACGSCGLTIRQFKDEGRLGCGACYGAFRAELELLMRRIHGATRHQGRTPARGDEESRSDSASRLRRLNDELDRAVGSEDYERAASLRDQIRRLEVAGPKGGGA